MTDSAPLLVAFGVTLATSFLLGLGLREYYAAQRHTDYFGSVRTYTFIGMLGFGLYTLDPERVYAAGLLALTAFLAIYYWRKSGAGRPGLIGVLTALLAYLLGPLALTLPGWFVTLFVVSALFALNAKDRIRQLSQAITQREVTTVAIFLTLAGVVLPLLPRETIAPFLPLTPYQIWLAIVVSTGISYASYLLQTFVFPREGLVLSGFLGGLYSSTATTFAIARRARDVAEADELAAALIAPTSMMYLRILVLVGIFNREVALRIAPWFLLLALLTAAAAWLFWRRAEAARRPAQTPPQRNPLELSSAALFAAMLALMATASAYVIENWPAPGLTALAVLAGFGDIEAFIISLVQLSVPVSNEALVRALVIATAANDVLKAGIALVFASRAAGWRAAVAVSTVGLVSLAYLLR